MATVYRSRQKAENMLLFTVHFEHLGGYDEVRFPALEPESRRMRKAHAPVSALPLVHGRGW